MHFRVGPAHDPGDGTGPPGVANDQHVATQGPRLAIERGHRLAVGGTPHDDGRACQAVVIERVHGMAQFEQHVVGDVDHVADGAHPACREPIGQPLGRRADRDLGGGAHVATAEVGGVDADGQGRCGPRGCSVRAHGVGQPHVRLAERLPEHHGNLTCNARNRHAVGTVGRHVEVEQPVVALGLEAFQRQPAQREPPPDFLGRLGHVDKFPNPRQQHFHRPNCSRKRRSFS